MKLRIIIFVILVAIGAHFFCRKRFVTHRSGVILITGCGSGIGKDAAINLAQSGYTVLAGVRRAKHIDELNSEKIHTLVPITMDVTKEEHVFEARNLIEKLTNEKGIPFVGVVNNAGLSYSESLEFLDVDKMRHSLEVNTFGPLRIIKAIAPLLRQYHGRIVNIGTLGTGAQTPFLGGYLGPKSGLDSITDIARRELAPFGVSVSIVKPGLILSNMANADAFLDLQHALSPPSDQVYGDHYRKVVKDWPGVVKYAPHPSQSSTPVIRRALLDPYPSTYYTCGNFGFAPGWLIYNIPWALPSRLKDLIL